MISQLTVFLRNEKGRLASAVSTLADSQINLLALFVADTADFGVARIFSEKPKEACESLIEAGYRAALTPVIAVPIDNEQGSLAHLLSFLDECDVNIEYSYCFTIDANVALNVIKVQDSSVEAKLQKAGFKTLTDQDVYDRYYSN